MRPRCDMPPLSEGVGALAELFARADERGEGLTLTPTNVELVAATLRWLDRDVEALRARARALEIEVAALEAVGRALELPLDDTPAARARAETALLDAMADGKVVMIDQRRRPAFCDGAGSGVVGDDLVEDDLSAGPGGEDDIA